jgi:hypothetical protein
MQFGLNAFRTSAWSGHRQRVISAPVKGDGMVTIRTEVPQRVETQNPEALTKWQKVIGVCLLLFYITMIAVTIATLPYVADNVATRSTFE